MLPDATRHRWAFVLADEVIATAMLNAYGWDAFETYLPKSVDKGIDSLTMPNDTWCQARCDVYSSGFWASMSMWSDTPRLVVWMC